jgi:Ca2+-binding RTX toxin-like protein
MIGQAQLSLLGATLYANGVLVSDVNSDGYLSVALSDAVAIKTDHNLTVDEINSITSSITSTTADGSDSATTTTTALLDIAGTSGDDVIPGSIGDDMIHGEDGTDTLIGGLGNDILTGGDGADIFKWTADDINIASGAPFSDTITDFSITEGDKLDLSDVLTGDTTTLSNYLDVQASGSDVVVSVYADGVSGGTADMTIVLEGQSADLTALQTYLLTQNGVIH